MSNILNDKLKLKEKKIKNIINILDKCNISSDSYNSTKEPFFNNDINKDIFKLNNKVISHYNIPDNLNRNIILIYNLLSDPLKEIYIGEWTIFSLKFAIEQYNLLCKANRKDVFDIGYRYLGLGHIELISCDLSTHLLFYRPDGGSNGYDREFNYNNLINNGSKDYNKFFFGKWFYNIKV